MKQMIQKTILFLRVGEPESVIEPETDYEGGQAPLEPSERGWQYGTARQLRDPGIYEEEGVVYLLYAVAAEQGIALARLEEFDP